MAKKTYTFDMNGATTGDASVDSRAIGWDTDAAGFQGSLNSNPCAGGFDGWVVTGSAPFTIEQPEAAGNFDLAGATTQGTLDTVPIVTVTQQWTPTVNLSRTPSSISEPGDESVVTFAIAATHSAAITVEFSMGGTATETDDYTKSTTSPVALASGESTATMSITVIDDAIVESNETITVSLGSITGGEAGTSSSVSITLTSDDIASLGGTILLMGVG